jgi:ferritin-like metal-binding protein YciE
MIKVLLPEQKKILCRCVDKKSHAPYGMLFLFTDTKNKTMAKASKSKPTNGLAKTKATNGMAKKQQVSTDPALMELFIDEIKDIYWAEKHLTKALPKMKKAASSEELANAIGEHLEATKEHVARLEQVFELLGKKAQGKKCEAMAGLVEEGQSVIEDTEAGTATRDVGLILAAQKVEHYEIATYGGLATLAKVLGLDEIKDLLGQTLDEEKEADELLTSIAENGVNYEAAQEVE